MSDPDAAASCTISLGRPGLRATSTNEYSGRLTQCVAAALARAGSRATAATVYWSTLGQLDGWSITFYAASWLES